MFKAVIVEDEQPTLNLMRVLIGRNPDFTILGTFVDPMEALKQLPELRPDVVFLDIEMPEIRGLKLAQEIKRFHVHAQIVFTTAYPQYALKAFDVQALDYILKPVSEKSINRVRQRLNDLRTKLQVGHGSHPLTDAIRCFGDFEVRNSTGARVRFPTRKTEELFAYFLMHPNQEINKWKLAEMLWPEKDGERALHNVHGTIYRLKKVLDSSGIEIAIVKTVEGYMLDTGELLYDVLFLQQTIEDWNVASINQGLAEEFLARYHGPLMAGKSYLWKIPLEERFRMDYERIMTCLVKEDVRKGEIYKVEERLHTSLIVEPDHVSLYASVLEILKESGYEQEYMRLESHIKKLSRSTTEIDECVD